MDLMQAKTGGTEPSEANTSSSARSPTDRPAPSPLQIPRPVVAPTGPRIMAQIELMEVQRIRDELARLRDHSPRIRILFSQVAGLYQRLARSSRPEPRQREKD